jgi:hypothetical protein
MIIGAVVVFLTIVVMASSLCLRGSLNAEGVAELLSKMAGLVSPRSKQVITKCVADSDKVTLAEFVDLWRTS